MSSIKKILCTTDFSAESDRAIAYAVGLGTELDVALHLLHVYAIPTPIGSAGAGGHAKMLTEIRELAEAEMKRLIHDWHQRGAVLTPHIACGAPARAIVDEAVRLSVDLIIMGTHGRTGLAHLLIGSVTERVVRTSSIPVLTIPMVKGR